METKDTTLEKLMKWGKIKSLEELIECVWRQDDKGIICKNCSHCDECFRTDVMINMQGEPEKEIISLTDRENCIRKILADLEKD